jgi:predicted DNA-binding protein
MRSTISVRLPEDLAEWLDDTANKTGVSQGKVIRDQLEKARTTEERSFLRLAGAVSKASTLSTRKGFSKK